MAEPTHRVICCERHANADPLRHFKISIGAIELDLTEREADALVMCLEAIADHALDTASRDPNDMVVLRREMRRGGR